MAGVLEKLLILNMVVAAERSRLDYVILVAVKVIGEKGWFAGEQPKATIESLMMQNSYAQMEKKSRMDYVTILVVTDTMEGGQCAIVRLKATIESLLK